MSQIGIPSNPKPMEGKLFDVRFFTATFTGECNYSSSTRNDVVGILGSAFFLEDDYIEEPPDASLGLGTLPPRPSASSSSTNLSNDPVSAALDTAQDSVPGSRK